MDGFGLPSFTETSVQLSKLLVQEKDINMIWHGKVPSLTTVSEQFYHHCDILIYRKHR